MAERYQIIALYTEGVARYQIGKKIDPSLPLDEENVKWLKEGGKILRFSEYSEAKKALER